MENDGRKGRERGWLGEGMERSGSYDAEALSELSYVNNLKMSGNYIARRNQLASPIFSLSQCA